jgi:hypothetical protein
MSVKKPEISLTTDTIAKTPVTNPQYTSKNVNGSTVIYNRNDTVTNQGRLYKCLKATPLSPLQDKSNWAFAGMSEIFKGSVPPIKPVESQLWLADTGVMYTWYKDINGFQWVQI